MAETTPGRLGTVIWAPPAGVATSGRPDPDAIRVFERAMKSLQRQDYPAALSHFQDLVARFSNEHALADRARVYAALCERELDRSSGDVAPETVEERLTAATAALNNGEDRVAEQLLAHVLDETPDHELGYYLLAVVHARRGARAAALDALRQAITLSPDVRAQARHDVDFDTLRGSDAFERLMAGAPAQSGASRSAQPHSER